MTGLSGQDRERLLSLLEAEGAAARGSSTVSPLGVLVFLAGIVLFSALSLASKAGNLPWYARSGMYLGTVSIMVLGVALTFFRGGGAQARARQRAEVSLEHLAARFGDSPMDQNLEAAVRLLVNAYYSGGPWMVSTIDAETARDRLERAGVLPWMIEVESYLVGERRAQPLLTLPPRSA